MSLNEASRDSLASLISTGLGAITAAATGSSVNGIVGSANTVNSIQVYNHQLHKDQAVALAALIAVDPSDAARLKAADCFLTQCSASIPKNDKDYNYLCSCRRRDFFTVRK